MSLILFEIIIYYECGYLVYELLQFIWNAQIQYWDSIADFLKKKLCNLYFITSS